MAPKPSPQPSNPPSLPPPSPSPWQHYTYTPTERHIFAPSPYKDLLLPLWRFSTPSIARNSAEQIYQQFERFSANGDGGDFIGMDNARKFLQMGMTRAARYANHKGGRKYAKTTTTSDNKGSGAGDQEVGKAKGKRKLVQQEEDWEGREEKREASRIFRAYWERVKGDERYVRAKEEFLRGQREWERETRAEEGRGGEEKKVGRGGRKRKREVKVRDD